MPAVDGTTSPRPMPEVSRAYDAQFLGAYDGDTQYWRLNKHPHHPKVGDEEVISGRLLEVNTAELRGPSRDLGLEHLQWVMGWITSRREQVDLRTEWKQRYAEWPFRVFRVQYDKYGGRFDIYIFFRPTSECLNDAIIEAGLSERYEPYEQMRRLGRPRADAAVKAAIEEVARLRAVWPYKVSQ